MNPATQGGTMTLTTAGRIYAVQHRDTSMVARIALLAAAGMAQDWPEGHRKAAVEAVNAAGAKVSA